MASHIFSEQFIGEVEEFKPNYTTSSFYVVGKSDKFVADFAAIQPAVEYKSLYRSFYNDQMEELKERKEREKMISEQKVKGTKLSFYKKNFSIPFFFSYYDLDFFQDVDRGIEGARNALLRHISTLVFGSKLEKNQGMNEKKNSTN